jgi:hypothetical protein
MVVSVSQVSGVTGYAGDKPVFGSIDWLAIAALFRSSKIETSLGLGQGNRSLRTPAGFSLDYRRDLATAAPA